jgi:hypothetical protein
MKKQQIIFWVTTILIFLFESVLPALTFNTTLAVEGIRHLGFPDYFRILLTGFKVLGGLALVIPAVPPTIKEWAYAGFSFTFIAAFVAHAVVDGINGQTFFPLVVLAILLLSYNAFHKLKTIRSLTVTPALT